MRIDSHQHFWIYDPEGHVWMTDRMDRLKRPFLPEDLKPLLGEVGFDGSVSVQARQSLRETEWLLELAATNEIMKGVVGWVDLCSPLVEEQLEQFAGNPKLKGVRHVLHDEPDEHFMLREEFCRGISALQTFGLTYDLLIFPRHLPVALQLVRRYPEQPFVVDHMAKPAIRQGLLSPWREDLRELARNENVYCKLSGLVTEAEWASWREVELNPYLEVAYEAFGPRRLMVGSDWPVCTLAGDYRRVMQAAIEFSSQFSPQVQGQLLGDNCADFYGIGQ